ncbi:hypothetical protein [Megamonas funiformis]|uniref:hypothetical protein n=1 Tax=Megamonas funiformis TaxID=437897 RepID=UPI00241CFFF5|nr:hypothetical protein [Megamonas funiformis]
MKHIQGVNFNIKLRGTYGNQFPRYIPECVAQLPLLGKDHSVVISNLKLSFISSYPIVFFNYTIKTYY